MSNVTRDKLLAALDRIVANAGRESDLPDLRAFIEAAPQGQEPAAVAVVHCKTEFVREAGMAGLVTERSVELLRNLPDGAKLYAALAAQPEPQAKGELPLTPLGMDHLAIAYGWLWHINNEPIPHGVEAAPRVDPARASYKARHLIRDMLTSDQRGAGILAARNLIGDGND